MSIELPSAVLIVNNLGLHTPTSSIGAHDLNPALPIGLEQEPAAIAAAVLGHPRLTRLTPG